MTELLGSIDNSQHFFVMRGVILFGIIQGARVEPHRSHCLVILSLTDISSNGVITGICNKHNWIRRVWINWSTDGRIAGKAFYIIPSVLLFLSPVKYDVLLGKVRENSGPMRQSWNELTDIIDEAIEFSDF